jgi:predicted RNase H-like nuclease
VIGIDLAWSDATVVNETGVVAADGDGSIVGAGWTHGVDQTLAWVREYATDSTVLFVDAPLLVLNPDGQRLCEKHVGQRYGRWRVSAHSTNMRTRHLAGVRLRRELEVAGWGYSDGITGPPWNGRHVSECYPHTTAVGATELGYATERPLYKRKPKHMPASQWRPLRAAACDQLINRIAGLRIAAPALDLRSHPITAQLLDERSPLDDRAYKHREDLIDACLAAWTASLWVSAGLERCQVLGTEDPLFDERGRRATIIAPARPSQRASPARTEHLRVRL